MGVPPAMPRTGPLDAASPTLQIQKLRPREEDRVYLWPQRALQAGPLDSNSGSLLFAKRGLFGSKRAPRVGPASHLPGGPQGNILIFLRLIPMMVPWLERNEAHGFVHQISFFLFFSQSSLRASPHPSFLCLFLSLSVSFFLSHFPHSLKRKHVWTHLYALVILGPKDPE